MTRFVFTLFLGLVAWTSSALSADAPVTMNGRIEGKTYVSPTGAFKVQIPVLPELGGEISDTPNVVTFDDSYSTHVSIAAFPQDATQRWELQVRGMKDYLASFFANYVFADFQRNYDGVRNESAKFVPGQMDGTLLTSTLIPGGTMFTEKVAQFNDGRIPVAKRGNLLFVKNGYIFVISIELAERVIEGKTYNKTPAEEDEILRQRLNGMLDRMQFSAPPAAAPSPVASPTPAGDAPKDDKK